MLYRLPRQTSKLRSSHLRRQTNLGERLAQPCAPLPVVLDSQQVRSLSSWESSPLGLGARNAWDGIPLFPWLTLLRARYSARTPSAKSSLVYRESRSICSSANRAATTRCSSDLCTSGASSPVEVPESASIPSTLSLAITEGISESEL